MEVGDVGLCKDVLRAGFSSYGYQHFIFFHPDTTRSSVLPGMLQLFLQQTMNALALTSKATALTFVFFLRIRGLQ